MSDPAGPEWFQDAMGALLEELRERIGPHVTMETVTDEAYQLSQQLREDGGKG